MAAAKRDVSLGELPLVGVNRAGADQIERGFKITARERRTPRRGVGETAGTGYVSGVRAHSELDRRSLPKANFPHRFLHRPRDGEKPLLKRLPQFRNHLVKREGMSVLLSHCLNHPFADGKTARPALSKIGKRFAGVFAFSRFVFF